jgi:hypothetical protein
MNPSVTRDFRAISVVRLDAPGGHKGPIDIRIERASAVRDLVQALIRQQV